MDDFPFPQEFDYVIHIRVVRQTQNVVVGNSCFLLCCKDKSATFANKINPIGFILYHIPLKRNISQFSQENYITFCLWQNISLKTPMYCYRNVLRFGNSLAYGNVVNEDLNHLSGEVFEVCVTLDDLSAVVADFDFYVDFFDLFTTV